MWFTGKRSNDFTKYSSHWCISRRFKDQYFFSDLEESKCYIKYYLFLKIEWLVKIVFDRSKEA